MNDFDLLLANTYLEHYMEDNLLDVKELTPSSRTRRATASKPGPARTRSTSTTSKGITQDSSIAFGLHPNAEIDFRTTACDHVPLAL